MPVSDPDSYRARTLTARTGGHRDRLFTHQDEAAGGPGPRGGDLWVRGLVSPASSHFLRGPSPRLIAENQSICRREPQPKGQNPLRMATRTISCAPARIPSPQPGIQPGSHPLPRLSPSKTHGKGYGTGRYPSCRYREPRPARSKQGICAHARPRHDPRLGQLRPRAP